LLAKSVDEGAIVGKRNGRRVSRVTSIIRQSFEEMQLMIGTVSPVPNVTMVLKPSVKFSLLLVQARSL
jgi:hypothetical protein